MIGWYLLVFPQPLSVSCLPRRVASPRVGRPCGRTRYPDASESMGQLRSAGATCFLGVNNYGIIGFPTHGSTPKSSFFYIFLIIFINGLDLL